MFSSLTFTDLEVEEAGRCFGASIGLSKPLSAEVTADLKLGGNLCKKGGRFSAGR